MKRILKLLFVFIFMALLSGCGKNTLTKCTMTSDQSKSGYVINTEYNIYSNKNLVNQVVIKEVVESKNNTILAYFKNQLEKQYKANNNAYKGYAYKVTNKDGKVTAEVTIDYSKMDLKKYIKDNPAMKSYVDKNNKPTLKGVKNMYESSGAKCNK